MHYDSSVPWEPPSFCSCTRVLGKAVWSAHMLHARFCICSFTQSSAGAAPALEHALICCCAYMSKAAWMANLHAIFGTFYCGMYTPVAMEGSLCQCSPAYTLFPPICDWTKRPKAAHRPCALPPWMRLCTCPCAPACLL